MAIQQTEKREAAFKHVFNILHSSANRSIGGEKLQSLHPTFSENLIALTPSGSNGVGNLDTKIKQIRTWQPATELANGHQVTNASTIAQKIEAIYSGSFVTTYVSSDGSSINNGARPANEQEEGFQHVEKVIIPLIQEDGSNGQFYVSLDWGDIKNEIGDTSKDGEFTLTNFSDTPTLSNYPFQSSIAGIINRDSLRLKDWLFQAAFGSDYAEKIIASGMNLWPSDPTIAGWTSDTGFGTFNSVLNTEGATGAFGGTTFNPVGGTIFIGSPDVSSTPSLNTDLQNQLPLWIIGYRYIGPKGANLLEVSDDGVQKTSGATKIDFTGGGVTVTNTGTELTVNIPGSDTTLSGGGGVSGTGAVGAVGFYSAGSQISGHAGFVFDNDPNSLFLAGDMTMSGILSASSGIISKLEHSNGVYNNVVTYDTTTGRLFYTESYGTSGEANAVSGIFNDSGSAFVTTNNLQVTGSVKIDGALSIPGFDNVATTLTTNTSQIATNVTDIANATNRTLVNYSNIENLSNLVNQPVKTDSRVQFATVKTNQNFSVPLKPGSASFDHIVMTGDIIPFKGHTANLGSREKPWRELYISGQTIYFISGSDSKSGSADHKERGRIQIDDNANFAFLSGSDYREMTASHLNITNGDITINEDPAGSTVKIARGSGTNAPGYISSTGGFGVIIDSLSEDPVAFTVETNTVVPGESGTRLLVISESGNTTINGDLTVDGTVEALIFTGDGSGLTGIAADSISATAISHLALTSSISGAFAAVSNSFSNRVTTLEGATVSLPANLVSSSVQLADDISGSFNGVTSSFITNSQTGSFLTSIPGGTYSSSLQVLTHITASGNISASGDIYASNLHLSASGATIGGANTTIKLVNDDYWEFFANNSHPSLKVANLQVVVNDNGSAIDFRAEGDTNPYLLFVDASEDKVAIGSGSVIHGLSGSTSLLTVDGDMTLNGTITASGNISASGNITTKGINLADDSGNDVLTIPGASTGLKFIGSTNNVERIYWDGSNIITAVADNDVLQVHSTGIKVENHITASGNVSASGTITATNYNGSLSNMTGTIDGGTF